MSRASVAFASLAFIGLSSCAPPVEQCEARVSSEAKQISRLIADVQANISRGYAWENEISDGGGFSFCAGSYGGDYDGWGWGGVGLGYSTCYGGSDVVRTRVPIDPAAEIRKRDALQKRLDTLSAQGAAACAAKYGEPG
ncbi:hypothetical protein ACEUZ9_000476 [Paracoccus litorisediminis]|uniref:hypothetical protein n=1 Tax=Paracoccus litorisediminis TaxID=2006130 RepID=UPI003733F4F5